MNDLPTLSSVVLMLDSLLEILGFEDIVASLEVVGGTNSRYK